LESWASDDGDFYSFLYVELLLLLEMHFPVSNSSSELCLDVDEVNIGDALYISR
jgi:hypothetical protein